MRATCHCSSVQRRYYSGVLSLSHIVAMALWMLAAFLPLLLTFGSREFVLTVNSYREQPGVTPTDQVFCLLEGTRNDSGQPLTLVHTTFPGIQKLYSNEGLRDASVKTSTSDINRDGIAESVHLEIAMPLSTNEIVRQTTVVVVLDYTLKTYAKLNIDVLALYRHSSPFGGDMLFVDGDLDFYQRNPLEITDNMQRPYIDTPIVNMTNTTQDFLLQSLIGRYRARNYTANLHAPYAISSPSANLSEETRIFRVLMEIRIDATSVLYTPEWPEIAKNAWIQYYCIFIAVSTLATILREYIFTHRLLPSVCVIDELKVKNA